VKRILFCAKCGEECEWETAVANVCKCGSRRFTTNKARVADHTFDFNLTLDDRRFLRALRILID
jgi:DNA-directed RNA polymerase subunit RPC12/RpoP